MIGLYFNSYLQQPPKHALSYYHMAYPSELPTKEQKRQISLAPLPNDLNQSLTSRQIQHLPSSALKELQFFIMHHQADFRTLIKNVSDELKKNHLGLHNYFTEKSMLDELDLFSYLWENLEHIDMTALIIQLIQLNLTEAIFLLTFHPVYKKEKISAHLCNALLESYDFLPSSIVNFYIAVLIKEHLIDFASAETTKLKERLLIEDSQDKCSLFKQLLFFIMSSPVKDLLLYDFLACNMEWRDIKGVNFNLDNLKKVENPQYTLEEQGQYLHQCNLLSKLGKGCLNSYLRPHPFNQEDLQKLYKDFQPCLKNC